MRIPYRVILSIGHFVGLAAITAVFLLPGSLTAGGYSAGNAAAAEARPGVPPQRPPNAPVPWLTQKCDIYRQLIKELDEEIKYWEDQVELDQQRLKSAGKFATAADQKALTTDLSRVEARKIAREELRKKLAACVEEQHTSTGPASSSKKVGAGGKPVAGAGVPADSHTVGGNAAGDKRPELRIKIDPYAFRIGFQRPTPDPNCPSCNQAYAAWETAYKKCMQVGSTGQDCMDMITKELTWRDCITACYWSRRSQTGPGGTLIRSGAPSSGGESLRKSLDFFTGRWSKQELRLGYQLRREDLKLSRSFRLALDYEFRLAHSVGDGLKQIGDNWNPKPGNNGRSLRIPFHFSYKPFYLYDKPYPKDAAPPPKPPEVPPAPENPSDKSVGGRAGSGAEGPPNYTVNWFLRGIHYLMLSQDFFFVGQSTTDPQLKHEFLFLAEGCFQEADVAFTVASGGSFGGLKLSGIKPEDGPMFFPFEHLLLRASANEAAAPNAPENPIKKYSELDKLGWLLGGGEDYGVTPLPSVRNRDEEDRGFEIPSTSEDPDRDEIASDVFPGPLPCDQSLAVSTVAGQESTPSSNLTPCLYQDGTFGFMTPGSSRSRFLFAVDSLINTVWPSIDVQSASHTPMQGSSSSIEPRHLPVWARVAGGPGFKNFPTAGGNCAEISQAFPGGSCGTSENSAAFDVDASLHIWHIAARGGYWRANAIQLDATGSVLGGGTDTVHTSLQPQAGYATGGFCVSLGNKFSVVPEAGAAFWSANIVKTETVTIGTTPTTSRDSLNVTGIGPMLGGALHFDATRNIGFEVRYAYVQMKNTPAIDEHNYLFFFNVTFRWPGK